MLRRDFLACAGAVVALSASLATSGGAPAEAQAPKNTVAIQLNIDEMYEQLAGGKVVYSVAFRDPLTRERNPKLKVHEGDMIAIKLVNHTSKTRAFAIMSIKGTSSTPIRAGGSTVVRFKAPPKGNYMYHDPTQAKLSEVRSLFGDLTVLPK